MFSNNVLCRPKKTGFTLIELVVSLSVVGVVILPLLLTSTTIISKGLVDSASHSKSNFQLSEMFNQMGVVFDSSSTMVRPDNFTTWDPRQEFQITYYNANRGVSEKVGYRLRNVGDRWFLQKLLDNGMGTGNEVASPYGTLASDQVVILPPAGQPRPQFNYCLSNGTCSNDRDTLTTDFLSGLDSITLEMQGVQITAPGIKQNEGRLLTGNRRFMLGKKYTSQGSGDLNTASAVSVTPLTDFYGVTNQNQINALSASLNKKNNTSLVLPTASQMSNVGLTAPQTVLTGGTILRVVTDQIRGNYAFVAQKAGATNLYFYNAVKSELTLVTPNISPSGRPNDDFATGDYPLVIDEFTGKVFWTSSVKGTATNLYNKADAGAGPNKMHLLGWDPYQPTLGIFLVDSRDINLNATAYTLIPDHQNGTLWALQDNGETGTTGNTQIVGIDTYSMKTVFDRALSTIAGASTFDYLNSWGITHGEGASVSGDLFLAALNTNNNRMGMVYLKANRDGTNVSITSRGLTTTEVNTPPATSITPDDLTDSGMLQEVLTTSPFSPNRLVVNDTLRTAGFLSRRSESGGVYARPLFITNSARTALERVVPLPGSSIIPAIDPPFNPRDSHQPRQMRQWFPHNFYTGISNSFTPWWGNSQGALWVNSANNDDPYFGSYTFVLNMAGAVERSSSSMTMNVTAGTFPNFTFGNLISRILFGTTYRVNYPATGHCFHDMGINGSQVMTTNETVRAYSAVYAGTSTDFQPTAGDNDCKKQRNFPWQSGEPGIRKGVMIQRNTKTGLPDPYQNIQYFFRDMNGQDPWMMPVQNKDKVVFTYWDGTNYRLGVFTGGTTSFTAGLDSARPSVPATFMQAAKEKDIIAINYNRMELMVTNADGNVVLWKFGGGLQNNAVARNGNFSTRQAESLRHLRLENVGLEFVQDAVSIAEDNSSAYVLIKASTRNGVTKPTRLVRFKCDARLKEGSKNNSSFCYRMSEVTLPADFPISASMDLTVNQSADSTEAFVLVDENVYRIPDRNMIGAAPNSVSTRWWNGFGQQLGAGIAHSSRTGKLYIVRSNEGREWRAGDHWSIRGSADRRGLLVAVVKPNKVHDENILLPMESWAVDNAFNHNTHYSGRRCGLRIDDQRGLLHVICQNNNDTSNPRNFVYTYQKPASYQL
jgi:prepilin-type N-terminal cleavage/methylation domain-containing protein